MEYFIKLIKKIYIIKTHEAYIIYYKLNLQRH